MYELKDVARVWYRSVVTIIWELGGISCKLYPMIFYWKDGRRLKRLMCSHVDDFFCDANEQFEREVVNKLKEIKSRM